MNKVVVCGSINMDIVVRVQRHPIPGETLASSAQEYFPGGKGANQAVAAARSGVETVLLGAVGDDGFGVELVSFLQSCGIDVSNVARLANGPTGTALIAVDVKGENTIIVTAGANGLLDTHAYDNIEFSDGDVVLAQNETPMVVTESVFTLAKTRGTRSILNPAPAFELSPTLIASTDYLVVNEHELGVVSNLNIGNDPSSDMIEQATKNLRTLGYDGVVIVTLGSNGVIAFDGGNKIRIPGIAVSRVVDTTGAGDCFVGNFAGELSRGSVLADALHFANVAASLSVQHQGAGPSMPSRSEVVDNLS